MEKEHHDIACETHNISIMLWERESLYVCVSVFYCGDSCNMGRSMQLEKESIVHNAQVINSQDGLDCTYSEFIPQALNDTSRMWTADICHLKIGISDFFNSL